MKKPQLLLHIGSFKTGTTALQDALAAKSGVLAGNGVLYHGWQDDGLNRNHSFIAALLLTEEGRGRAGRYFSELAHECHRLGAGRAIVSAEGFYSLEFVDMERWAVKQAVRREEFFRSRREYIQRLQDSIANRFDIKVIVYLRRQDYFLNSLYNQLVKDVFGYTGTIRDFVEGWGVLADYASLLDLWAEAFGADALMVRVYEKQQQQSLDVVSGFFTDVLGFDGVKVPGHQPPLTHRDNLALPRDILEYKRVVNRLSSELSFEDRKTLRDDLIRLASRVREVRGLNILLSPAERVTLLSEHEKGNQHVARRYLGSAEPLFTEPPPALDMPYTEYPGLSVERSVEIGVALSLLDERRVRTETQALREGLMKRWRRVLLG
jgi:hypothetical protein